jgi:5-carboxymethyl-2-hydroxymuconate isomerase
MAHLILEYSANLAGEFDVDALFAKLHGVLEDTGLFPVGGLRSRAYAVAQYRIADGDPSLGFANLTMKIGHGRSETERRQLAEKVFASLSEYFDPLFARRGLALSFEMTELSRSLKFNRNNIHEKRVMEAVK